MDIQDKMPCFESGHRRNNSICLTCQRPTPLFPEWVGKIESLRAQLSAEKKRADDECQSANNICKSLAEQALRAQSAEKDRDKYAAQAATLREEVAHACKYLRSSTKGQEPSDPEPQMLDCFEQALSTSDDSWLNEKLAVVWGRAAAGVEQFIPDGTAKEFKSAVLKWLRYKGTQL